jgi:hypothetical protein
VDLSEVIDSESPYKTRLYSILGRIFKHKRRFAMPVRLMSFIVLVTTITLGNGDVASAQEVHNSPQELLRLMPNEKLPRSGSDGLIERKSASEWIQKNLAGKIIAIPLTIQNIKIEEMDDATHQYAGFADGNGEYKVTINYDSPTWYGPIQVGNATSYVHVSLFYWDKKEQCVIAEDSIGAHPGLVYFGADERLAKALRALNGTKTTLKARIVDINTKLADGTVLDYRPSFYFSDGDGVVVSGPQDLGLQLSLPAMPVALDQIDFPGSDAWKTSASTTDKTSSKLLHDAEEAVRKSKEIQEKADAVLHSSKP